MWVIGFAVPSKDFFTFSRKILFKLKLTSNPLSQNCPTDRRHWYFIAWGVWDVVIVKVKMRDRE